MTTEQTIEFKKELKENFIPRIELMLKKEKEHLQSLKDTKVNLSTLPLISNFLMNKRAKFNEYVVDDMIKTSEANIRHIEMRLEDYCKYVEQK